MKRGQKIITLIIGMIVVLAACKDEYFPEINELDREILVVEGYIDGADETAISLSRVTGMGSEPSTQKYVTGALVQVEDDQGNTYPLYHFLNGTYKGRYQYNPLFKYRVKIKTENQKEYASQFVSYKISPPIDEITYRIEPEGVRFLMNTHDNSRQSIYYRWLYSETWQFRSNYMTEFQYDSENGMVVDLKDSIYNCWQSDYSTEILLNNTADLGEDVMKDIPMSFVPNGSLKLSYIYSINVKQFVMDSVGYAFFRLLKRNTEETGSIFDPQPGNLKGNLVNLNDPNEMVVGYIGAGSSTEKREYFTIPWNYRQNCSELITVPNVKFMMDSFFLQLNYWPISEDLGQWVAAPKVCVDCRIRGTNIKPDFWP